MKTKASRCLPAIIILSVATLAACADEATAPRSNAVSPSRASTPAVAMDAEQATQQIQAAGTGWRVYRIAGVARAADSTMRALDEEVLVADSLAALDVAPLPSRARREIKASFARLPETEQGGPIMVSMAVARQLETQVTPQLAWPECEAGTSTWSTSLATLQTFTYTQRAVPGAFQGEATFTGFANPHIASRVTFNVVRGGVWPACVPVAASVRNLALSGGIDVAGSADVHGTFVGEWNKSVTVISPQVYSELFFIGALPIWLTVELPIDVGIGVNAKVAFSGKATASAHGDFSVACTSDKCTTSKNTSSSRSWTNNRMPTFDARAKVSPFIQGSVKLLVYWGAATGQIGLRATLKNDVWAYAGSTCGDANNDGTPEFVRASTLDARLALALRASVGFVGQRVGNWSWPVGGDYFIGFYDLIGSSALTPIFYVSGRSGTTYTISGRMRPCWPYSNEMSYSLDWGDRTGVVEFLASPATRFTRQHVYPTTAATYTPRLVAKRDAASRVLNRAATLPIKVGGM